MQDQPEHRVGLNADVLQGTCVPKNLAKEAHDLRMLALRSPPSQLHAPLTRSECVFQVLTLPAAILDD
jgi:hypothetical protein